MPLPFSARLLLRRSAPWLSLAGVVLGLLALCLWAFEPPPPTAGAPRPDQFSERRARAVVDHLSETIGVRLNGTPGHRRAAEYLAAQLRQIPGLEVQIQDAAGTHVFATVPFPPFVYRTLNVVARLPGRSATAVLLDAHFDTQLDSVGAADDAAGVAALVETVRVLAREAPLAHTLIVNLNGAEEIGLLGAAAFLKHPWAKDVRAYVYVEALPGGLTGLFGAGPGNPWLAKTFARAVPRPYGSSVGQDLVQAQLLPHNGDFTPFHEAGLSGLDMAMTGDGWAYHTMLDRTGRLQPGSLQHLGETALAVTRALASDPLPTDDRTTGAVYYDFLGLTMAAYSKRAAGGLAVLALLLAAGVGIWAARRGRLPLRPAVAALGWTLLATLAGLLAAVAAAALVALGLGRPQGWFSAPGLVVLAFGAPAAAAIVGVHAFWHRRRVRRVDPEARVPTAVAGGLLVWSILLALASVKGIGAGYLALHWVTGGALALYLSVRAPRRQLPAGLACLIPALLLTLELAVLFLSYFIPITGMLGSGPTDLLVAALVGVTVAAISTLSLPLLHAAGGFGRAALVLSAVGVVGLTLIAARFPYTANRPKRVSVSHVAEGDQGTIRISHPFKREIPAPPPAMPPPRAAVEANERLADGDRRVTVRIFGTSPLIRLTIPKQALLGWSITPALPARTPIEDKYVVQLYDLEPAGHALTLTLRGQGPVDIELRATDGARASGAEVQALLRSLPPWVTVTATASRTTKLRL